MTYIENNIIILIYIHTYMQLDRKVSNYRGWTSAGLAVNISEWTC